MEFRDQLHAHPTTSRDPNRGGQSPRIVENAQKHVFLLGFERHCAPGPAHLVDSAIVNIIFPYRTVRFAVLAVPRLCFLIVFEPRIVLIVLNHNQPPRPLRLWRQRSLGTIFWRQRPLGSTFWWQTFGPNKTKIVGSIT